MSRWVAWLAAALILSGCHRHAKPEPSPAGASTETTANARAEPTPELASPTRAGVARPATA
ncbi:MAG: hypothetical protein ACERK0_10425, partial [Deltaproteobacteria bacterium]